jgi:hypothetical protein
MVGAGVILGDREVPRRKVIARIWTTFRAWWRWTTALPGDRFELFTRDLLLEVRSGLPRRRQAAFLPRRAVRYPVVQRLGLDEAFALCPSEPCHVAWWEAWPA